MSNTNADDKLIGFEYQFFYFLLSLLKMQIGDTVGFEVQEDVHIENDGKITFCQLKHTIQTDSQNKPKNLTTSDKDLWKTLSLWVNIINKKSDKNEFLKNAKFIFVSNKSNNDNNAFLTHFTTFQNDKEIDNLKDFLNSYKNTLDSKDKKREYLNNILSLDDALLKNFFLKIKFLLNLNEIRQNIKDVLKNEKYIKSDFRIDQAYEQLIGLLKDDFFEKVIEREKVQYSRDEFAQKVTPIFEKMRSDKIPFFSKIEHSKEVKILDRVFAKQLKDIGIEDDEEIYEYDYNRVLTESNLKELHQSSEITKQDIDTLDENTLNNWKPIYRKKYIRKVEDKEKALEFFYDILDKDLYLAGQILDKAISNGQFIKLSNIPKIGWKYNWKEYENNE
ncbi:hypothetical protein KKC13_00135 [bacterium]|nr:hypothetical protein [bacterium]MBU1957497.1 hypothetical protein [bacterium]